MVPLVELRRLLSEARAAGESFSLTYRQRQQGSTGAAGSSGAWRRVRIKQKPGQFSCSALADGWWRVGWPSACTVEERQLLTTAPPAWAMRLLLFFPFPMPLSEEVDVSSAELGCLS